MFPKAHSCCWWVEPQWLVACSAGRRAEARTTNGERREVLADGQSRTITANNAERGQPRMDAKGKSTGERRIHFLPQRTQRTQRTQKGKESDASRRGR